MSDIKAGDRIVITSDVPESDVYPFAVAGCEGVVVAVHPNKSYPYSVTFEGAHCVDPKGCPVIVQNPVLLFDRGEIELKEED
jgi:hypothetical protein